MASPNHGGNYGRLPWLAWVEEKLVSVEVFITLLAFVPMLLLMVVQVVFRYVLLIALPWAEEIIRYLFIAATFLGVALVSKERCHISIDIFDLLLGMVKGHKTKEMINYSVWLLADVTSMGVLVVFAWLTYKHLNIMRMTEQMSSAMEIPVAVVVGVMLLGVCLMIFHYAVKIINNTFGHGREGEE